MPSDLSASTVVSPPHENLLRLLGLLLALSIVGCATTGTVKQIDKLDTVDENA
jgi:hypothetical protein